MSTGAPAGSPTAPQPSQGTSGASSISAAPSSAAPRSPLPPQLLRRVSEYLHSRGYRASEAALRQEQEEVAAAATSAVKPQLALDEAQVDDDLRGVLMVLKKGLGAADGDAGRYEQSYRELRDWVDGSLDLYKGELHSVLYPIMVHCFLEMVRREQPEAGKAFLQRCASEFAEEASATGAPRRKDELVSLAGISLKHHLEENEAACLFLKNRYELHLSSYAFELLVAFLSDDPRRGVLLRIINQRCRVRLDADADRATRIGASAPQRDVAAMGGFLSDAEKAECIAQHSVLWGRLSPSMYIISDEEAASLSASASGRGKSGAGNTAGDAAAKKDGKGGKGDAAAGAGDGVKKGSGGAEGSGAGAGGDGKGDAMDVDGDEDKPPHVRADGTLSEALVPLKRYRIGAQGLETEDDVKSRAPLGHVRQLEVTEDKKGDESGEGGGDAGKEGGDKPKEVKPPAGVDSSAFLLPSVLCYTYTNTRSDGLNCSALSQDGSHVAAGFGDSSVRLWDAKASGTAGAGAGGFGGKAVRLIGHSGPVYSVDWTKCSRFVLSGSEDGTVRLWSAITHADLVAYRGHNYPVWSVGFSPLDHYFASGSHDRSARVWVTDRVYPLRIFCGHLADVDVVRWHPNCSYVATGSADRTARLWDLRDGRCARVFGTQTGAVQSLAFSPDGRTLAVAGESRDIDLWDISMGRKISSLKGHTGSVWSLDYSRDGSILASGGADESVRLWKTSGASGAEPPLVDGVAGKLDAAGTGNDGGNHVLGKRSRVGGGGSGKSKDPTTSPRSDGLVASLRTKQTPVHLVHFTRKNLLIAAGSYSP